MDNACPVSARLRVSWWGKRHVAAHSLDHLEPMVLAGHEVSVMCQGVHQQYSPGCPRSRKTKGTNREQGAPDP